MQLFHALEPSVVPLHAMFVFVYVTNESAMRTQLRRELNSIVLEVENV